MNTQLTTTQRNRNMLAATLDQERDYVSSVIPSEKVTDFRNNYLELSNNSYLIEKIPPKEILQTAANATALGLNVSPVYRECYILPFSTKGKGIVASIVISKDGLAQTYFNAGFLFKMDRVWNINGTSQVESKMNYETLALLKPTSHKFVVENLIGWEVSIEDISTNEVKIPLQKTFVGLEYAMEVTKQLQSPEHSIQTYEHKVARRADRDFFIPRFRKSLMLEKIEDYNNTKEFPIDVDIAEDAPQAKNNEKINPMSLNQEEVILEGEVAHDEEEIITPDMIIDIYKSSSPEMQAKIVPLMSEGWREFSPVKVKSLLEMIKAL